MIDVKEETMQNQLSEIIAKIEELKQQKGKVIIAIDGRCASGKSTLAGLLENGLDCNVIHMDSFFLQAHQRTEKRLAAPGGNIDHERFLSEVLLPLRSKESFSYREYLCHSGEFSKPIFVPEKDITVIEGSYSCHPELFDSYDMRIFVTTDPDTQLKRIIERDGESYSKVFQSKWIPLEEKYFSEFSIMQRCDIVVQT